MDSSRVVTNSRLRDLRTHSISTQMKIFANRPALKREPIGLTCPRVVFWLFLDDPLYLLYLLPSAMAPKTVFKFERSKLTTKTATTSKDIVLDGTRFNKTMSRKTLQTALHDNIPVSVSGRTLGS